MNRHHSLRNATIAFSFAIVPALGFTAEAPAGATVGNPGGTPTIVPGTDPGATHVDPQTDVEEGPGLTPDIPSEIAPSTNFGQTNGNPSTGAIEDGDIAPPDVPGDIGGTHDSGADLGGGISLPCKADLNGDDFVGFADLMIVLSNWNDVETVGFNQLVFVLSNWGACA